MTGEVKRYIYSWLTGTMAESSSGNYVTHADHLAVVEGLRADAERYRWMKVYDNAHMLAEDVIDEAIEAMRGGDGRG